MFLLVEYIISYLSFPTDASNKSSLENPIDLILSVCNERKDWINFGASDGSLVISNNYIVLSPEQAANILPLFVTWMSLTFSNLFIS